MTNDLDVVKTILRGVEAGYENIDKEVLECVCDVIANCSGKIIFMGLGKSGLIGKKLTATFSSVGLPSFFIHPTEAAHGDLGMVQAEDVIILLSNSGESHEFEMIFKLLKKYSLKTIGITGRKESYIGRNVDFCLSYGRVKEACPLELAPTTSSTTMLVIGDLLAIKCMRRKSFSEIDFAKYHPGGSLGKRLLSTVEDIYIKGTSVPLVSVGSTLLDIIKEITKFSYNFCVVKDGSKTLGIITDGDIRRELIRNPKLDATFTKNLYTHSPITIDINDMAYEAYDKMEKLNINMLIVTENGEFTGVIAK
ncbi:SIS domain-containing protein [Thalassomonas sp. M1454]|uniref:KpsF/GutQ family sugar-phosphate isomerase n=1 Tax=Thalassomonas sp. M1454 TaxID=2594477 RepID=UPI001180E488|nr:KpsF/GutQ family sugar-phosphate isomerase [Thalassomonas sp. M1454]TRX57191.1 KpsF/GutQ family sugar-phosphate isomerase [Thalassomonas sp. M1454]